VEILFKYIGDYTFWRYMETYMFTMVKNKCTKMYLNKLQLYFWFT